MLTIRCPHLSLTNNRSFLRVPTQTYGETAERVGKKSVFDEGADDVDEEDIAAAAAKLEV